MVPGWWVVKGSGLNSSFLVNLLITIIIIIIIIVVGFVSTYKDDQQTLQC